MNVNKEFVEKKIVRQEDCFLIDLCQYQIGICNENNTLSDQYQIDIYIGLKGQGGLIMRKTLMILVMVVLRIRPKVIGKVFGSLETEVISCILMRCYGKRKGRFKRRGDIKGSEIKRLVF
jgi:hypothetical protein